MIGYSSRQVNPPVDVIELPDKLVVIVEIAGMRHSDFRITLLKNHLIISGTREKPQHNNAAYHRVEIRFGEFRVDVPLPWPVQRDSVGATYEAGFLQVELPRKQPQHIQVVDVSDTNQEQD